jgi:NAD(P)-dependent dehydrogenase (short-subunit alcohol dehydrogenase family)
MRLDGKVAIVVGAGQTPGETIGNGRATAIRFARAGARVLAVDRSLESATETVAMIEAEGGQAVPFAADATREDDCRSMVAGCLERYGRVDILHNNVGRSEGDAGTPDLPLEGWQSLLEINLTTVFLACKHVLPVMRAQRSGVILNVSSTSARCSGPALTYRTAKAGINAMTCHLAIENAPFGIRVNSILPGLIDTPMAIERRARERGLPRETIRAERDAQVPLGGMGTAWDVAAAALFLACEEARYITGVLLPVDGGLTARVG